MRKNKTVYLSKSTSANPDDVMKVRQYLQGLGFKVEEWEGGTYYPNSVLETSMMIMVGYKTSLAYGTGILHYEVGKGQYEQLKLRESSVGTNIDNLYFAGIDSRSKKPVFRRVKTGRILNETTWKTGYGAILPSSSTHLQPISFEYYVEKNFINYHVDADGVIIEEYDSKPLGINDYLGIKDEPKRFHLACSTILKL